MYFRLYISSSFGISDLDFLLGMVSNPSSGNFNPGIYPSSPLLEVKRSGVTLITYRCIFDVLILLGDSDGTSFMSSLLIV